MYAVRAVAVWMPLNKAGGILCDVKPRLQCFPALNVFDLFGTQLLSVLIIVFMINRRLGREFFDDIEL